MKERIIGATVLVLFVVLVVPVFLDGPDSNSEVITQTVPLPGQSGNENQTIVLHRDREHPVPAANSATSAEEEAPELENSTPPAPQRTEPQIPDPQSSGPQNSGTQNSGPQEEEPPEQEEPAPEPDKETAVAAAQPAAKIPEKVVSSTGMWAVQLGSFGNQENANKLAADLRNQNFTAFLSKLSTGNGELHRVRIGPQKDRESAEKVAAQLAKAGHKGQVVPHP